MLSPIFCITVMILTSGLMGASILQCSYDKSFKKIIFIPQVTILLLQIYLLSRHLN